MGQIAVSSCSISVKAPVFMYIVMHITTGSRKGACCLQQMHEGLHPCKTLITSRAKETKHSKQNLKKHDKMILVPRKESQHTGHRWN
jgi:hypothetical protein